MALAVIKDRVKEITKDVDWKQKMADEWNNANEEENVEAFRTYERPADMKSNAPSQSKKKKTPNLAFRDRHERSFKVELSEADC